MPTGFDHFVIAVNDLEQTTADYAAAGFTVTPGGEHKHGISHNALVTFQDSAYFELIAFRNDGEGHGTQWPATLKKGEGFVDYALRTDDLEQEVEALRSAGLGYSDPKDGGRFRPDGQRVDWQTIRFEGSGEGPARLPFYCHDLTERSLRVPGGSATEHANGVTGVTGVSIVVHDLESASEEFGALSGADGVNVERGDGRARRFPIGSGWIEVIEPALEAGSARAYLDARGELPFEITLSSTKERDDLLDLEWTHGARLVIAAETRVSS